MRWWSIPIAAGLVWFLYTLTPFWALYDLAGAVRARDAAHVARRVNLRGLRTSLARQLSEAIRAEGEVGEPERRGIADIADTAAALALPLADALITPAMVIDLLDDGWPQSLDLPEPETGTGTRARPAEGLGSVDAGRLAAAYLSSEMRGFGAVVIALPPGRPPPEQFKIRMRMHDWSWQLVDIRLNAVVRARIAEALARARTARGTKPADERGRAADR